MQVLRAEVKVPEVSVVDESKKNAPEKAADELDFDLNLENLDLTYSSGEPRIF